MGLDLAFEFHTVARDHKTKARSSVNPSNNFHEDLSKLKLEKTDFSNSWFLRTCKKLSEIHTGDISSYISWIAATLTITIAILVGFLYIQTFYAMIVTVTIMIVFFSILTFFLKR